MNHQIQKYLVSFILIAACVHVPSAHCQTEKLEMPASALLLTPKKSAEMHMKDPEVVPITAKWIQANPGRLVVSLDAACNGTNNYYFELNSTNEALFYTKTIMWIAVEPKKDEIPLVAVVSTNTTTAPSKKLKFSVNIPSSDRVIEAVVEITELREFKIDGKAIIDEGIPAVDALFANAREPFATRYNIHVTDPTILGVAMPSSGQPVEQGLRP